MRLIRVKSKNNHTIDANSSKLTKSKSSLKRNNSAACVTKRIAPKRNRSLSIDRVFLAKKSKSRVASPDARRYKKSIDRIVNSQTKNVMHLTPKYTRQNQELIARAARSVSAKSLLLPKRRVIVSPFHKNARGCTLTAALARKRARSAFG
jgi:hypothetical protein